VRHDELEELYRAYAKEVYLYALALCKDAHLAEDLTCDTFYKALLSLDSNTTGVKFWLLRVCKNLFIDWQRKKRRERGVLAEEAVLGGNSPLDTVLQNDTRQRLYRSMLRLSETDREMLAMFYFLDCGTAQIAALLGRSAGAVKTGLSRARARLKKILEEEQP
jgi:RNA polymerase sigma-70 factor (ECF subfamily)